MGCYNAVFRGNTRFDLKSEAEKDVEETLSRTERKEAMSGPQSAFGHNRIS